jgi:subtilisin
LAGEIVGEEAERGRRASDPPRQKFGPEDPGKGTLGDSDAGSAPDTRVSNAAWCSCRETAVVERNAVMADSTPGAWAGNPASGNGADGLAQVSPTGRYVMVFNDDVHGNDAATAEALRSVAGVTNIASTRDFAAGVLDVEQANAADATVFAELGVAVVAANPDQATRLATAGAADARIVAVEPERILYAIAEAPSLSSSYLLGYRDAVTHLCDQAIASAPETTRVDTGPEFVDTPALTWGLQATKAATSSRTGQGTSVAVLDTGLDLGHPDFAGRQITAQSFVPGESPQDMHGHGTHCIGTACGPRAPSQGRRYGIACGAQIMVGKVLNNVGSGTDTNILAGINWAMANGCTVISMSLGADVRAVSVAYEKVGRRALDAGTLIVAAAGNNADRRFGNPGFVGVPANSPSIMAVAAVDERTNLASFSARSNPVSGGQIDIAGPGVNVYSSWPMPHRYNTISGTSMATPHVAGIAALWSEATGDSGPALWKVITQAARELPLPVQDVGAGLVQAPQ